jgi:hypothetical protein
MAPDIGKMLADHDAALVIGDPALQIDRSRYLTLDLAEEWIRHTGKPFVFAFWAVRQDALKEAALQAEVPCGDSRPRLSARAQRGSLTTPVNKFPKHRTSRLKLMLQPQHRLRNLTRTRSRKPYHSYATAPGRRRNSNNRIVEVHRAIVAVKLEEQPAAER